MVKGRKLLSSLISMAKTLEIHTLTEGVETKEQSDFLKNIGCEVQQGFYNSKPISEVDILGLLSKEKDNSESREDRKYWNRQAPEVGSAPKMESLLRDGQSRSTIARKDHAC